ncbi:C3a anaphylatoxin chemotactic receptor [Pelobates cultripes]|uniref:C3a anaphylatoxin chemotactic receptor n=1 Tax=Pelobates cultripes TaxID=61616 RepID=A0AAD1WU86_PELCU|nr:C3a anaphylatoxin chemotactic receptor [Pelobates cultripes]
MVHYTPESIITVMILMITFLVGVPGNILVIWITSFKMKRTVNTVWFWNLALADITCCLSLPLSIALELLHNEWPYGSFLCKVLPSIIILNMFASVFTLVAISVDRCILVVKPVWAQNHRSVRSAWLVCLVIWFISFLMCLPLLLYRETITENNITTCGYKYTSTHFYYEQSWLECYDNEDCNFTSWNSVFDSASETESISTALISASNFTNAEEIWTTPHPMATYSSQQEEQDQNSIDVNNFFFEMDDDDESGHNTVITITRVVFGFFLPAIIISACYIRLAWKMQNASFSKMSKKTLKVVFSIILAFYISWTPYHLVGLTMLYVHSQHLNRLDHLSQALAYSNSCVNPILYVFMGKEFKSKMRKSMLGLMESAFSEDVTQSTNRSRSKACVQDIYSVSGQSQAMMTL